MQYKYKNDTHQFQIPSTKGDKQKSKIEPDYTVVSYFHVYKWFGYGTLEWLVDSCTCCGLYQFSRLSPLISTNSNTQHRLESRPHSLWLVATLTFVGPHLQNSLSLSLYRVLERWEDVLTDRQSSLKGQFVHIKITFYVR